MYKKDIFEKILSIPEDEQRKLIKWRNFEEFPKFLKFSSKENEEIITALMQLNLLFKRKGSAQFFEILNAMNAPDNFYKLYAEETIGLDEYYLPCTYDWRIDISISKANAILLNANQFSKDPVTFRLDITTFHKFRFNIALILSEINKIKKASSRIKLV